jgi:hypothetical protein
MRHCEERFLRRSNLDDNQLRLLQRELLRFAMTRELE